MIVKIQRPLVTNEDPPLALVYNKDRSFTTHIPYDEQLTEIMGGEDKQYWKIAFDPENGDLILDKKVRARKW